MRRSEALLGAKRRGSRARLGRPPGLGSWLALRGALQLDLVGAMDQPVADGIRQGRLADHLVPALRRKLARDECRGPLAAIFEDLEQVAPFLVLERGEGEVVDDEQVHLREPGEQAT